MAHFIFHYVPEAQWGGDLLKHAYRHRSSCGALDADGVVRDGWQKGDRCQECADKEAFVANAMERSAVFVGGVRSEGMVDRKVAVSIDIVRAATQQALRYAPPSDSLYAFETPLDDLRIVKFVANVMPGAL